MRHSRERRSSQSNYDIECTRRSTERGTYVALPKARFHCSIGWHSGKVRDRHARPLYLSVIVASQLCPALSTETLHGTRRFVRWLVSWLTSQQHASASQGRICRDNFTCCHTEIEVANQTFSLTQSQYADTGPTSPSPDPIMPGAWQGSRWSANV